MLHNRTNVPRHHDGFAPIYRHDLWQAQHAATRVAGVSAPACRFQDKQEAAALKVLINRSGGAAKAAGAGLPDQVRAAFAAAGGAADIHLLDGGQMAAAVRDLSATQARLVVAGGDGTISCAAGILAGTATELAILPLGTLNHFARDTGIPADLAGAAAVAIHGRATQVDTAQVGTHSFINNVSFGIYPMMVRSRDAQEKHGWSKRAAALPAAWAAFTKAQDLRLVIDTGAGPRPLVTPLLFIGNNNYSLDGGSLGHRAALDAGELCVFAVRHRWRLALAWFALRTLVGKADPTRDFLVVAGCKTLRVAAARPDIEIAIDGELNRMTLPLELSIRPATLNLVVGQSGNTP